MPVPPSPVDADELAAVEEEAAPPVPLPVIGPSMIDTVLLSSVVVVPVAPPPELALSLVFTVLGSSPPQATGKTTAHMAVAKPKAASWLR
jgi:hypothetical protein